MNNWQQGQDFFFLHLTTSFPPPRMRRFLVSNWESFWQNRSDSMSHSYSHWHRPFRFKWEPFSPVYITVIGNATEWDKYWQVHIHRWPALALAEWACKGFFTTITRSHQQQLCWAHIPLMHPEASDNNSSTPLPPV